jgi:hypothetical protein
LMEERQFTADRMQKLQLACGGQVKEEHGGDYAQPLRNSDVFGREAGNRRIFQLGAMAKPCGELLLPGTQTDAFTFGIQGTQGPTGSTGPVGPSGASVPAFKGKMSAIYTSAATLRR